MNKFLFKNKSDDSIKNHILFQVGMCLEIAKGHFDTTTKEVLNKVGSNAFLDGYRACENDIYNLPINEIDLLIKKLKDLKYQSILENKNKKRFLKTQCLLYQQTIND